MLDKRMLVNPVSDTPRDLPERYSDHHVALHFARSGIAWDGDSFKQLDSRSWARAKDKKMPPLLFLHHPQGKAAETIQLWLTYVTDMLKNPDSTPTIAA